MYVYEDEKPAIFTESGQVMFLSIRDRIKQNLKVSGSIRMAEAMSGQTGSTWQMMACVDRLVELGEIREITKNVAGQDRVFVGKNY
jgi:hypothetical protein